MEGVKGEGREKSLRLRGCGMRNRREDLCGSGGKGSGGRCWGQRGG